VRFSALRAEKRTQKMIWGSLRDQQHWRTAAAVCDAYCITIAKMRFKIRDASLLWQQSCIAFVESKETFFTEYS
jgi:hypothetical protein